MLNIAVLFGGTSSERDISIKSGKAVASALASIGHRVTPVQLDRDSLDGVDLAGANFAFLVMHGGWGEGGGLQSALDERGIAYSGCGPVACNLGLDKELSKGAFLTHRVPTPPYEAVSLADADYRLSRMARRLGYPLVVKPTKEGSSIGVSFVRSPEDHAPALAEAFKCGDRVLIEKAITGGKELTVAIIGARAYPVVQIETSRGFFDFNAKYQDKATVYNVKPDITAVQAKMCQHIAKRAHNAIRAHGYSRVDIMMDAQGEFWVLEVNTLPGMTERSLLPLAAKQAGLSYEETLQAMIDASLAPRRLIPETSGNFGRVGV